SAWARDRKRSLRRGRQSRRPGRQTDFLGQSFVADPFGRIIAKASHDRDEVLVVECDLSKIEETRQNWPFLRDRRIDAYEGLRFRFGDSL
ncbi:MAG TPA: nitrilase-related carbon-nitrogen hydrolase, partial [Pyrinomonadaceae bacterium]|nr:nitrilase-related carbon-nitrogen hydrolase [Pyrinomonadaceae bacterium]